MINYHLKNPLSADMPIVFAGLVVVPWLARSAGHLIRFGQGLIHPISATVDPADPELHESPVDVAPPAQTDVKGRNCSNLRLLYQNNGSHCRGLDCLSIETLKNPEQETSVWIGSCPVNERTGENMEELDSGTPQPAGRGSEGTVAVFLAAQEKVPVLYSITKAGILTGVTSLREKVLICFARIAAFYYRVRETISSFFTKEVRLYLSPSKPDLLIFSREQNHQQKMQVVFHRAESQLQVYGPTNRSQFSCVLPKPEQEVWLSFPEPGQGLLLYFPQSDSTYEIRSNFPFVVIELPQSEQAFLVNFYGPLEKTIVFVLVAIIRSILFMSTVCAVIADVIETVTDGARRARAKLAHVPLGLGQYRVYRCVASVFSSVQERIHTFFDWIYARSASIFRPITDLHLDRNGVISRLRVPTTPAITDFVSGHWTTAAM